MYSNNYAYVNDHRSLVNGERLANPKNRDIFKEVSSQVGTDKHLMHLAIETYNFEEFFKNIMKGANPYDLVIYNLPNNKVRYNDVFSTASYFNNSLVLNFMSFYNSVLKFDETLNAKTSDGKLTDFNEYYHDNFVKTGFIQKNMPVVLYIFAMSNASKDPLNASKLLKLACDHGYTQDLMDQFDFVNYMEEATHDKVLFDDITIANSVIKMLSDELKTKQFHGLTQTISRNNPFGNL